MALRTLLTRLSGNRALSTLVSRNLSSSSALYSSIINIQDNADFEKHVKQSKELIIVDFHAELVWCGPCKVLGPRLESTVTSLNVSLAKVDIDDNSDLAMDYGVQVVPTVLAMKNGAVVDKFEGAKDENEIKSFISKNLPLAK